MTPALLTITDLALHFGGLKAVDGVSFSVRHGEIFAIIGPNGAGKTTILNMISRIYAPTKGTIELESEELTLRPSHSLPSLGVARTFQNIELFAGATVLSNILLGCQVHRRTGLISELLFTPGVLRQEIAFRDRADQIIAFLDLGHQRRRVFGRLSV